MSILSHFRDQHPGTASIFFAKGLNLVANAHPGFILFVMAAVHAGNAAVLSFVTIKVYFHCVGHFTHRGAGPDGINRRRQEITLSTAGNFGDRSQCLLHLCLISFCAQLVQLSNLSIPNCLIVDLKYIDFVFGLKLVFVHPDNHVLTAIDASLFMRRGFFDAKLG